MAQVVQDFIVSEESKDTLISKIQDLEFVESRLKLRAYSCCKCGNVAIRHRIANCDHVFCHGCYRQLHHRPCPVCAAILTESKRDENFEKTVLKLKVACEFREHGCPTVVNLWNLLGHIGVCRFATEQFIPEVHKPDRKADALEQINANFKDLKNVMQEVAAEIKQLNREIKSVFNNKFEMDSDVTAHKGGEDMGGDFDRQETTFYWTIMQVRDKLRICKTPSNYVFASEEFSTPTKDFSFKTTLSNVQSYINITNVLLRDHVRQSTKYILVDLSNGEEKQDVVLYIQSPYRDFQQKFNQGFYNKNPQSVKFFPLRFLEDGEKYVKNDMILIKIVLEPIEMIYKRVVSRNGVLLWTIHGYSKKLQEEKDGIRQFLTSDTFYTSAKGHRLDVELYLNGHGQNQGKGLSLFPKLRIGQWDWMHVGPIVYSYERYLVDQSDAPTKTDISIKKDRNFQSEDLVSWEDAEKFPYLKDDTLVIKIVIKPFSNM